MATGVMYGILKHVNAQPVTEPTQGLHPIPIPTPPVSTDPASPKPKIVISPVAYHVSGQGQTAGQLSKAH
jgi:hypothetical protein